MTEITKFTCPMCYHERFTPATDKPQDNAIGACCVKCHYTLNASDVEKFDRILARKILLKAIDK